MTIKELKDYLNGLPNNTELLVSSDEELNTLYQNWEIAYIEKGRLVIFGLSGSELEE